MAAVQSERHNTESGVRRRRWLLPLLLPAILILYMGIVLLATDGRLRERLIGAGVVLALMALAWLERRMVSWAIAQDWCALAARTNLQCRVRGWFSGFDVGVRGQYRARQLALMTTRQGKGQVAGTRIELRLANRHDVNLRLRGPFDRTDMQPDRVSDELFAAAQAQRIDAQRGFYLRGKPEAVGVWLREQTSILAQCTHLQTLTNIELTGDWLTLEQLGILRDIGELQRLFDLLSDLADAIESRPAV